MTLRDFDDVHCHGRSGPRMITSVGPDDDMPGVYGEAWYSVGVNPWDSATATEDDIERVRVAAADPRVVAVGEAGLDARRGGEADVQECIFLEQARIAEEVGKPLIVHCVGRYGRLMELHRAFAPRQLWVVHGFRGKPELARQLVALGMGVSLGVRYNPDVPAVVPPHLLFHETDTYNI